MASSSAASEKQRDDACTIYAKTFSTTTTEGQVENLFSHFGRVLKVRLRRSQNNDEFKGSVYVEFSNAEEAKAAVAAPPQTGGGQDGTEAVTVMLRSDYELRNIRLRAQAGSSAPSSSSKGEKGERKSEKATTTPGSSRGKGGSASAKADPRKEARSTERAGGVKRARDEADMRKERSAKASREDRQLPKTVKGTSSSAASRDRGNAARVYELEQEKEELQKRHDQKVKDLEQMRADMEAVQMSNAHLREELISARSRLHGDKQEVEVLQRKLLAKEGELGDAKGEVINAKKVMQQLLDDARKQGQDNVIKLEVANQKLREEMNILKARIERGRLERKQES